MQKLSLPNGALLSHLMNMASGLVASHEDPYYYQCPYPCTIWFLYKLSPFSPFDHDHFLSHVMNMAS